MAPSGRPITAKTRSGDVEQFSDGVSRRIIVVHPEAGAWRVQLTGDDVPAAGEAVVVNAVATSGQRTSRSAFGSGSAPGLLLGVGAAFVIATIVGALIMRRRRGTAWTKGSYARPPEGPGGPT
jgi:hypothetical protein